jgi:hypothetical protein
MKSHTFFAGSNLKCHQILYLGYLWVNEVSPTTACNMSGHSTLTIGRFYYHFRQLVSSCVGTDDCIIGGPGIVVEVDETKMGKRKYNRGHRVEGTWVVGGVERTPERRVFLVPVERRSKRTLLAILKDHLYPESILHTDLWKGYLGASEECGVVHRTVNHSLHFKDPTTGTHTNTIEGTWNGLKMKIAPRNRVAHNMNYHLFEFIWRRMNKDNIWGAFMQGIRDIHYDFE